MKIVIYNKEKFDKKEYNKKHWLEDDILYYQFKDRKVFDKYKEFPYVVWDSSDPRVLYCNNGIFQDFYRELDSYYDKDFFAWCKKQEDKFFE